MEDSRMSDVTGQSLDGSFGHGAGFDTRDAAVHMQKLPLRSLTWRIVVSKYAKYNLRYSKCQR